MLRSLRHRLLISHAIPLLLILPILGISLVYILETQVLLPGLATELEGEAAILAELAATRQEIWEDTRLAGDFVAHLSSNRTARIMLLDSKGRILASSESAGSERQGQVLEHDGLGAALSGELVVQADYSRGLQSDIADILAPVMGNSQQVTGIIRLSYPLTSAQELLSRTRYLILGILIIALVVGIILNWLLSVSIQRPLAEVTRAIQELTDGNEWVTLPEEGPEEIARLAQAFNDLVQRLHTMEEARRHLLANLVHEIGRPLGALQSAIQALLSGADENPELRSKLLLGVREELGILGRLLDDLTGLHAQVLGTLDLNRRSIALDSWLTYSLLPWREEAKKKGLGWNLELSDDLPILEADSDRLGQALGNLLSNAIKYTPRGGEISIGAAVENESLLMWVSDTGPGIMQAELNRIFTPFFRGTASGRFPQGMGLGLTIARDLVAAHGGSLSVDSNSGTGSRFIIRLPLPAPSNGFDLT